MRRGLPEDEGATAAGPAAARRPGRVQRGGAVPAGPGRAGRQRPPRHTQGAGGAGAALRQLAPLPVAEGDQVAEGREAPWSSGGGVQPAPGRTCPASGPGGRGVSKPLPQACGAGGTAAVPAPRGVRSSV